MRLGLVASLMAGIMLALLPSTAQAQGGGTLSPSALCRAAIAGAERASGVPDRLMQAIGVIESGRRDELGGTTAWPWTINVEGAGYVFNTKQEAIAAVEAHRARGARSIDVGCMQVNLMHHGNAFASLDEAFDPAANARYAAKFLLQLLAQTGSWPRATAGYHSLTPGIGDEYARKVMLVWARPAPAAAFPPVAAASLPTSILPSQLAPVSASLSLPGSSTARIIPLPGGGGPGLTSRGLDAYRAAPTRLAARMMPATSLSVPPS